MLSSMHVQCTYVSLPAACLPACMCANVCLDGGEFEWKYLMNVEEKIN